MNNQEITDRLQILVDNGLTIEVYSFNEPLSGPRGGSLTTHSLSNLTMYLYRNSTETGIVNEIEYFERIHKERQLYENKKVSPLLQFIITKLNLKMRY